jgi:hypothetical protein
MNNLVKCNNCGYIMFTRTLEEVKAEVDRFNAYYSAQPREVQEHFAGRSSISNYLRCLCCSGPYTGFSPVDPTKVPEGITINPILEKASA